MNSKSMQATALAGAKREHLHVRVRVRTYGIPGQRSLRAHRAVVAMVSKANSVLCTQLRY